MSVQVKLPRALNPDLTEQARMRPTLLTIDEPLREAATAQMTLTERDPDTAMHDWMELYTAEGSAGIFRVTSMAWTVRRERVLTLRHAIDTLSDSVWRAQLDYSGTVPDFLGKLLQQQTVALWQLGRVDDTSDYKKSGINYDHLSDLLWGVAEDKPGYAFEFDFTTSPWTVSYVALPSDVAAECRLGRNVDSCRITYDDTEMCNRLYMTWSVTTTSSSGKAISKTIRTYDDLTSQATYGVIEKTADVEEADEPHPDDWAARFLAERGAPRALIEIDGQSLERLTGLTWDRLARGKKIQVALPDYGVTLTERCEKISHPDALGNPLRVSVELSNTLKNFSESLADMKKQTEKNSGISGAAEEQSKVNEENIAELNSTVASHGSSIGGLSSRMGAAETNIQTLQADIIYINGTELVDIKSRLVNVEAEVVTITTDYLTITAYQVDIEARLTTLNTTLATSITTGALNAGAISAGTLTVGGNLILLNENTFTCGFTTGTFYGPGTIGVDISGHTHGITFSESNGTITATIGSTTGTNSDSFSIAATQFFQDEVAAAEQAGYTDGYNDGYDAPGIDRIVFTPGNNNGALTTVAYADNGKFDSETLTFSATTGNWDNGEIDVYFRSYGATNPLLTKIVEMPASRDSYSVTVMGPAGSSGTVDFSITVAGKTYSVSGVQWTC